MPLPRRRAGRAIRSCLEPVALPRFACAERSPACEASPVPRRPSAPPRPTLYRSGLAARLLMAGGMAGLVWLAILWALAL